MTKREEVRLACIEQAISYYKASGVTGLMRSAEIVQMAEEFEKFVRGPRFGEPDEEAA